VTDVGFLLQSVVVVAVTASPIVILVRLIAGWNGDPLAEGFGPAGVPSWPRGVQEEEPRAWNFGAIRH
jgi:hypothetical protein